MERAAVPLSFDEHHAPAIDPAGVAGTSAKASDRFEGIANIRRHTARGVLLNGAFDFGLMALNAGRGLLVAVFLTRAQYGVWGLLGLSMWTALALKQQFGAGDKYVQQSEADQRLAFQRGFTVDAIFAAAVAPVTAAIVLGFALLSGHTIVILPGLLLLGMLPAVVLQFPLSAFFRRMDYRTQRRLQAVDPVVCAVVTIALAAAGAGYWSFVAGALAGSWTGAAVAVRYSPYPLAFRYESGTLRSYVRFSAPLAVGALSAIAVFQVIFMVGAQALGLAALGAFTLVGNCVQFTDQADSMLSNTLYPAICAVQDRLALLAEIFVKSNRLSLMWAVPFGVGLSLFASDLFRFVLGSKWLPAVPLLTIMGIVTAVHHVGYNYTAFFRARGKTWPIAVLAVAAMITFIGAGVPLMFAIGLTGLGWAFAAAEVVNLVIRSILLARLFVAFSPLMHLVRAFAPTLVAVIPVLALRTSYGHESTLAAALALFALYSAVTVLATAGIERRLLREAIGYIRRRQGDATASYI